MTEIMKTEPTRLTSRDLAARKHGERIVMLAAYDFPTARLIEGAGADMILVGDSLGMVFQGQSDHHSGDCRRNRLSHPRGSARGACHPHHGGPPFLSYQQSNAQAPRQRRPFAAGRWGRFSETRGRHGHAGTDTHLVAAGIPVVGHVGLGPQSVGTTGGFQCRDEIWSLPDA